MLGQPFMPWQQLVADIAGEVDPRTGIPIYREIVLLVPRQSGKTTLLLAEMVYRAWGMFATFNRPQSIIYAAQTGDDAFLKWKEHVATLERTPFGQMFTLDSTNGRHALNWANGSSHRPTATTTRSGHGKTLDQGVGDEYFAQIDFRVEQAFRPAMITRRDAQIFFVSTAGDATSIPLNAKIESNRERLLTEPDAPSRIAYIEFSAGEDMDPGAEETWWSCMPALGRTVHIDDIRAEHESMTERDFARAYLNITDRGASGDQVVPVDDWEATGDDDSKLVGPRAFALDVTNDRSWASVSWAGVNEDGVAHAEVIKHERNTHWIIPYLVEKLARNKADTVAVVAGSQAALMQDAIEAAGLNVLLLSKTDYAAACAKFYDSIIDHTMRHRVHGQIPLAIAISGAAWGTGDARVWSRVKSTTDISPLVACTVANWAYLLDEDSAYNILDSIA